MRAAAKAFREGDRNAYLEVDDEEGWPHGSASKRWPDLQKKDKRRLAAAASATAEAITSAGCVAAGSSAIAAAAGSSAIAAAAGSSATAAAAGSSATAAPAGSSATAVTAGSSTAEASLPVLSLSSKPPTPRNPLAKVSGAPP